MSALSDVLPQWATWPRYFARTRQVLGPDGLWIGPEGWFVADRETGQNVTAALLDPYLPPESRFRGRRFVTERQAGMLTRLANDPEGARALRELLMDRLGGVR